MDLGIARPGPLQPVIDRRQTLAVGIMGMDLAAIVHRSRQGQRLAAGTGAEVEHLPAGRRARKERGDLRSLVLDFEPALLEAGFHLDIGMATIALDRRDAHADRRQGARLRRKGLESRQHALAIGFQRVDAQIKGRPIAERGRLRHPVLAEGRLEMGLQPIRDIGAHRGRGRASVVAQKTGKHFGAGKVRRETVAFKRGKKGLGARHQRLQRGGRNQGSRALLAHACAIRAFAPKRVIDEISDRGPILGAGEAMGQPPVLQGIGDGPPARLDIGQNLDGCGQPPSKAHGITRSLQIAAGEKPSPCEDQGFANESDRIIRCRALSSSPPEGQGREAQRATGAVGPKRADRIEAVLS